MAFNNGTKACILILFCIVIVTNAELSKTGSECVTTSDCPDLHSCINQICVHKTLFPITAREVFGTIIILSLNALLTAGGVGAGAAYIPYITLLFSVTLQQAVYIGYACVFGGGVGNLANTIKLKNPATGRYLINFNINMIVLPALMIGVMVGIIVNRVIAPIMVNIILLLVLAYSTTKNYYKLKLNLAKESKDKTIKSEAGPTENASQNISQSAEDGSSVANNKNFVKEQISQNQQLTQENNSTSNNLIDRNESRVINVLPTIMENQQEAAVDFEREMKSSDRNEGTNTLPKAEDVNVPGSVTPQEEPEKVNELKNEVKVVTFLPTDNEEIATEKVKDDPLALKREILYEKERKFPFHKLLELSYNIIIIVVIGVIRGTSHFKPVVGVNWTCKWDFIWFAISIFLYSLCLARNIYLVLKWQKEKLEVQYEFLPEEPILDQGKIIKLLIVAFLAGVIGAIVALGGSMIVGPTLLDMKMPPAFSGATTGLFMIFSMFNTMFQTILNGKLSANELAWFLPLSCLFSFVSSKVVNWYIKKTGKQSTILICIMTVAILGFLCLFALLVQGLAQDTEFQLTFNNVCG